MTDVHSLSGPMLRESIDILLISYLIYRGALLFRGTAARQALPWLVALALIYWVALRAGLALTSWVLGSAGWVALVATVVLFRHEIRAALVSTGPLNLILGRIERPRPKRLGAIVSSSFRMAEARTGALIVLHGREGLSGLVREGVDLDAVVTSELLECIFAKGNPLHDGAVVIRGNRVERAGTVLPLSTRPGLPREYGTRHRAALGLSERSDALILVVSEERGSVCVVHRGAATPAETPDRLDELLRARWGRGAPGHRRGWWAAAFVRHAAGFLAVVLAVGLFGWGSERSEQTRTTVSVPLDFRNVPDGLELSEPAAEGARVQVAGRRFLVDGLRSNQVSLHVDLRGAPAGASTVALDAGNVDLPPGLEVTAIAPSRITIVLERRVRGTVPVIPVVAPPPATEGPPTWLVEPASVAVVGPQSAVERLTSLKTKPLDLSGLKRSDLPRTFETELELSPPSLRLAVDQTSRVRVTVRPVAPPEPSPGP